MKRKTPCEYADICRKADLYLQSDLSYWPRDERLRPYCLGEEDPSECIIHSLWKENPLGREQMRRKPNKLSELAWGVCETGAGQVLLWRANGVLKIFGATATLIGLYMLADGLSKRFSNKSIIRFLREIGERDAVDDVYNRILEITYEAETAEDEKLWYDEVGEKIIERTSHVKYATVSTKDVKRARTGQTRFKLGKMGVVYPLTDNTSLCVERDIGVVLSYEYEPRICRGCSSHTLCERDVPKVFYTTGVLFPKIKGMKIRKGLGFIQGTRALLSIPLYPVQIQDSDGRVKTGIRSVIPYITGLELGSIDAIFGSNDKFDEMSAICMDEGTSIDAKNVHMLMQETLYSDF